MIPSKEEILKFPMFPKYDLVEIIDRNCKTIILKSAVYAHLDNGFVVHVYKVPVLTKFELSKRKIPQEIIERHLENCYRVGKYLLNTYEVLSKYPLIDSISKLEGEENFTFQLHNKYP